MPQATFRSNKDEKKKLIKNKISSGGLNIARLRNRWNFSISSGHTENMQILNDVGNVNDVYHVCDISNVCDLCR